MIGLIPIEINETTLPYIIGIIIFNICLYSIIYKKLIRKK